MTTNTVAQAQQEVCCSFCRKNKEQVKFLIAGPPGVYICNECVDICNKVIEEMPPLKDQENN